MTFRGLRSLAEAFYIGKKELDDPEWIPITNSEIFFCVVFSMRKSIAIISCEARETLLRTCKTGGGGVRVSAQLPLP